MPMLKWMRKLNGLLFLVCLSLTACATVDYRGVQSQFEQAVIFDNGRSPSFFNQSSEFTHPGYDDVVAQLTTEYIGKLDERLRPNAYLLLSISQWRTGMFDEARTSAGQGLKQKSLIQQSRDHVVLMMVPGLVIDSEIEAKWFKAGKKFTAQQYEEAEKDFKTAFDKMKEAEQAMGNRTPISIGFYGNAQRYKVIENWRSIINNIVLDSGEFDTDEQEKAITRAKAYFNGRALGDVSTEWRTSVPVEHSLRQWMERMKRK